jgi:hypothetical protein
VSPRAASPGSGGLPSPGAASSRKVAGGLAGNAAGALVGSLLCRSCASWGDASARSSHGGLTEEGRAAGGSSRAREPTAEAGCARGFTRRWSALLVAVLFSSLSLYRCRSSKPLESVLTTNCMVSLKKLYKEPNLGLISHYEPN